VKDSGKKALPSNWQWVLVEEAVSPKIDLFDKQIFPKADFTYVDITSVDNATKRIVAPKTILTKAAPSRATYIVRTGDILIATVRPNLNAVAKIEPAHDGAVCSSGFCVLRFKEGFCADYFFYFFLSPQFVSAVTELVQGAMYPAIGDDDVTAFYVPAPVAFEEQVKIAAKLETRWQTLQALRAAAERQFEASSALPAAALREFFDFGNGVHA